MRTTRAWWLVGLLLVPTVGCNKGDSGATAGGSAAGAGNNAAPAAAARPAERAPEAFVQEFYNAVAHGNAAEVWGALPTKYQSDVAAVKNEFAAKMDAGLWNKSFSVLGKLARVLKEKKEFILKSEMAAGVPPDVKEAANKNWDDVVGMLATVAESEIKTLDGLKQADVGRFLATTGNTLSTGAMKAAESANPEAAAEIAKARKAKVALVKRDGDQATLKLETEGDKPEEKVFKQVDGKWLPAEMVDGWDKGIADLKADLAGTLDLPPEQKQQVLEVLTQVDQLLDKLAAAKDEKAFQTELSGAVMQFLPLLGAMGGGGAMSGPPPGAIPGGALPGGASIPSGAVPGGAAPANPAPPPKP